MCDIISAQEGCFESKSIQHGDSLLPVLDGRCRHGHGPRSQLHKGMVSRGGEM